MADDEWQGRVKVGLLVVVVLVVAALLIAQPMLVDDDDQHGRPASTMPSWTRRGERKARHRKTDRDGPGGGDTHT